MDNRKKLQLLAKEYLSARKKFLTTIKQDHPELGGNDNIVGRIGEFIALQYLRDTNRTVEKCRSATNKGYDILCSKGRQISVKTITAESKTGRSTRLKQPWHELIMIYIGENYEVEMIGHIHIERFSEAVNQGFVAADAVADKKFLRENELFFKFGELHSGALIAHYL